VKGKTFERRLEPVLRGPLPHPPKVS